MSIEVESKPARTDRQRKEHAERMREFRKAKNSPDNQLLEKWNRAFKALEPEQREHILQQERQAAILIDGIGSAIAAIRSHQPGDFDLLFRDCQNFIHLNPLVSDYCPDEIAPHVFSVVDHEWDDAVYFQYGRRTRLPNFYVYEFYEHLLVWLRTAECEPDIKQEMIAVNQQRQAERDAMFARISEYNREQASGFIVRN